MQAVCFSCFGVNEKEISHEFALFSQNLAENGKKLEFVFLQKIDVSPIFGVRSIKMSIMVIYSTNNKWTLFCEEQTCKGNNKYKCKSWFLYFARYLLLIDIHIKVREDILNSFQF